MSILSREFWCVFNYLYSQASRAVAKDNRVLIKWYMGGLTQLVTIALRNFV